MNINTRPRGPCIHSRRPRSLATMCGDVRLSRAALVGEVGLTRYPLDGEPDPPAPRWDGDQQQLDADLWAREFEYAQNVM